MMAAEGTSDLVSRARTYAADVHAADVRKGSGIPYFEGHLEPVARIVADAGGSDVQVAAAYLHDAAEDHGGEARLRDIAERFGPDVAEIVEDLSDSLVDTEAGAEKAPWRERKERYVATLAGEPLRSLEVAAADKLHNATSLLEDYRELGPSLWERFTVHDGEDHLWYYEALAACIVERLPDHPTARELDAVVRQLAAEVRGTE